MDEVTSKYSPKHIQCEVGQPYGSIVGKVGDKVTTERKVGKKGNTGNSTGTHLHLEASTTQSWQCDSFVNPR